MTNNVKTIIPNKFYGLDNLRALAILMVFFIIENADAVMSVMLRAAGYQTLDVRLYLANPIANVGLSCLFIPLWGGLGAAVARLAGGFGSSVLRYAFISRTFSRRAGFVGKVH